VTFAILHTMKWQCRYCRNKKYNIKEYNLEKSFKELKKSAKVGGESSDDEMMEVEADRIFRQHEQTLKRKARNPKTSGEIDLDSEAGRRNAAFDFIHKGMTKEDSDDSDGLDFQRAEAEEVEDQLLAAHKKANRPLHAHEVASISSKVAPDDLNESIVSTVCGRVQMTNASFRTGRMSTDYESRLKARSPSGFNPSSPAGSNRHLMGALTRSKPDVLPDMFRNESGMSERSVREQKMASSEIIVAADVKAKVNMEGRVTESVESIDSLVNTGDGGTKPNPFTQVDSTATSGDFGGDKKHKRHTSNDTAAFAPSQNSLVETSNEEHNGLSITSPRTSTRKKRDIIVEEEKQKGVSPRARNVSIP